MAIGSILTILSLALSVVKLGQWIWSVTGSDSAKLKHWENYLATQKALWIEARAKRQAHDAQVDAQPDKTGQALADDLNTRFGKKP